MVYFIAIYLDTETIQFSLNNLNIFFLLHLDIYFHDTFFSALQFKLQLRAQIWSLMPSRRASL